MACAGAFSVLVYLLASWLLSGLIGTLRYPGRGLGGRQPKVNSQGLEFNLHKCHATRRPPRQLRRRLSSFWRPLRKVS